ncbi:MAG: hypothetical protein NT075_37645 [Chloroflexi bacterium]|nr:hypothetical protein [Chloroflexota bacterium]
MASCNFMRRFSSFILFFIAILALFPLYTRYKTSAAPIPPGVYLGGLELSDIKNIAEIQQHLAGIYAAPIEVDFAGEPLALLPQEVDFQLDVAAMVSEAGKYLRKLTSTWTLRQWWPRRASICKARPSSTLRCARR